MAQSRIERQARAATTQMRRLARAASAVPSVQGAVDASTVSEQLAAEVAIELARSGDLN